MIAPAEQLADAVKGVGTLAVEEIHGDVTSEGNVAGSRGAGELLTGKFEMVTDGPYDLAGCGLAVLPKWVECFASSFE